MLHNMLTVIKFELSKNFKSWSFWLLPILFSASLVAGAFVPVFIADSTQSEVATNTSEVVLVDPNNLLKVSENQNQKIKFAKTQDSSEAIKEKMKKGEVNNLVIVDSFSEVKFWYTNNSTINQKDLLLSLNQQIVDTKTKEQKTPEIKLLESLKSTNIAVAKDSKSSISFISTIIGFLLVIVIFIFGSLFMNQIIVEKNTKVYEVILTSIDIKDFFVAKYLSFILKIIIQFLIFIVALILPFLALSPLLLKSYQSESNLPPQEEITSAPSTEFLQNFTPLNIAIILIFAVLGVILYTTLLSLVGASFNNYMEASNSSLSWILSTPITLALIFNGYFFANPNSFVSWFFQLLPLTSPISVTTYIFSDFSWIKIISSVIFLILAIFGSFKIAIKIYLEGVLSSGIIDIKKFWKIVTN